METLMQLFGSMIVFVYHCFDRIVIHGYLSILSRPESVVYFFREVVGRQCITKDVLSARTKDYNLWVQSYAENRRIPSEWAQEGVRKEEYVRPYLKAMERKNRFGVYFILKSMEQGATFRSVEPRYPTNDPNYRIVKKSRSRFTHYYFYLRDEKLGAMCIRVASFLPFQTTCYLNGHHYIERELLRRGVSFRKNDNAFLSVDDPRALQKAADSLTPELISERLDYWILIVGPKFSQRERRLMNLRRFYAISQIEYCHNFIFRQNFPIRKLFQRSCELGFFALSASKISNMFGSQLTKRFNGKLQTVLERLDHAHYTLRAYFKNSFVKQYEKFRTFLRLEVCSNHTPDLRVRKSLANLPLFRERSIGVLDRFAGLQANALNVHFDFPLFQRLALPITHVNTRIAGIKIHDTRMIRLMETIMHAGVCLDGWTSALLHKNIVAAYGQPQYTINQLRYDLRKMKAHGLVERNGNHYSYLLTDKGMQVAAMFVLFHKRICGPLANSLFHHRPKNIHVIDSKLEKAYHKADDSIGKIVDLLAA
jgi:hypothetical protein